jgi:DNA-binding NarL/FixJ family response regulator
MAKIRILIADDHALVREGICSLLARRKDMEVVGQAADGQQAVEQTLALHPDVVLMDISMPVMNGLEATRDIRARFPAARILVLTQHDDKEYVVPMLRAGAAGYILKRARSADLVNAIHTVYRDGTYLSANIASTLMEEIASPGETAANDPSLLTKREEEVVRLLAEGLSSREIAERLHLGIRTVDTHRAHIMEKIGVHSTVELVTYAIRQGIVRA